MPRSVPSTIRRAFDRFGVNVWNGGDSRYFSRGDDVKLHARAITVARDGGGIPANYALLLHAALTARLKQAQLHADGQRKPTSPRAMCASALQATRR